MNLNDDDVVEREMFIPSHDENDDVVKDSDEVSKDPKPTSPPILRLYLSLKEFLRLSLICNLGSF